MNYLSSSEYSLKCGSRVSHKSQQAPAVTWRVRVLLSVKKKKVPFHIERPCFVVLILFALSGIRTWNLLLLNKCPTNELQP